MQTTGSNLKTALFIVLLSIINNNLFAQSAADSNKLYRFLHQAKSYDWHPKEFEQSDTVEIVERKHLYNRFSAYEPNYFISNFGQNDFGQVKFQISFKFDLGFNFKHQELTGIYKDHIYFAFTQDAFWDLYGYSAPMRDLNFAPMLMWEHKVRARYTKENNRARFFFNYYKPGLLHQSNGQAAGPLNRSVFKAFLHTNFIWNVKEDMYSKKFQLKHILLYPQVWLWPKSVLADENKNIADYQGYGRLITVFRFDFSNIEYDDTYPLEISNTTIPAVHTSTAFDLKFNPFLLRWSWFPYIYVQYWYGYGESLLNYDNRYNNYKPENIFRIGLQFRTK